MFGTSVCHSNVWNVLVVCLSICISHLFRFVLPTFLLSSCDRAFLLLSFRISASVCHLKEYHSACFLSFKLAVPPITHNKQTNTHTHTCVKRQGMCSLRCSSRLNPYAWGVNNCVNRVSFKPWYAWSLERNTRIRAAWTYITNVIQHFS